MAAVSLALLPALTGCNTGKPPAVAEIVAFEPAASPLRAGAPAAASVRVRNVSAEDRTFWIGYGVEGPAGEAHDAGTGRVELAAGEESDAPVLTEPLRTPGYHDARVSVWSREPTDPASERLAEAEEASAFRVHSSREDFDAPTIDPAQWEATRRDLGLGGLAPENVGVEDENLLRLALPAETLNGSEVESKDLYGPGFYAARIRVPDAPSSITGFFLYAPPDLESEIDVEIYNEPSGRALFTTYAGGEQTFSGEAKLPFEPTSGFHDYAFLYDESSVTFYPTASRSRATRARCPTRG